MSVRRATHAGSWYSNSGDELNKQLTQWLSAVDTDHSPARAIIAPHAGYSYCGACGAYAYRQVSPESIRCIFILGPSHHVGLSGCALSPFSEYRTPLYDLTIDQDIYRELNETQHFEQMSASADENEHSIELHLAYIAKVMERYRGSFTIVPILVGSLSPSREALYGRLLAPYLRRSDTLFVVSSDFCHWGGRFGYTRGVEHAPAIGEFIERLDGEAMSIIETLQPAAFTDYLKRTGNTICGRHPIGVLLNAIATLRDNSDASVSESGASLSDRMRLKFVRYAQSSHCSSRHDSSVSYASASLVIQ